MTKEEFREKITEISPNSKTISQANSNQTSHSDIIKTLKEKSKDELITLFIKHLKEEHHATDKEVNDLISKEEILIPIKIFDNEKLSSLESIVKYLKENRNLKFSKIAKMLNRDDRSIWTTYHNASKKLPSPLLSEPSKFFIPLELFAARKLSVLETLSTYLKDTLGLSYHEIAELLRLNDRTIWTTYNRAKKK
ncbi:MAG: sigma factor-like helix-turn-helix DNA-binding protein [Nanoarchaeota archaeon]|nr:sigma factor-like helix-turn-helix DNA-binding protein [Nanoarchaeota archaeon]